MFSRRDFIKTASGAMAAAFLPHRVRGEEGYPPATTAPKITKIEIVKYQGPTKTAAHLEIVTDAGAVGRFGPLGWGIPEQLQQMSASLGELLVGKDPLDCKLEFEAFWDALHPGNTLAAYADGIDLLTGQKVWGTTRGDRRRPA